MDNQARKIGIENITASQASNITSRLDRQVEEFRSRSMDVEYPVPWVDALYEKARDNGKVRIIAVDHGQ
ncbi:transposase [Sphaerochaeta sp.]|uniref:transposase n=1 Tax=Sphaerochaeta sp. TaxID=1972642 RepID=UPI003D12E06C